MLAVLCIQGPVFSCRLLSRKSVGCAFIEQFSVVKTGKMLAVLSIQKPVLKHLHQSRKNAGCARHSKTRLQSSSNEQESCWLCLAFKNQTSIVVIRVEKVLAVLSIQRPDLKHQRWASKVLVRFVLGVRK